MTLLLPARPPPHRRPMPPVRISVDQYHRMIATGIIPEGDPIELLDGQLARKDRSTQGEDPMSVGPQQSWVVNTLGRSDAKLVRLGCHMQNQQPLSLPPVDEPEPDGMVVRGQIDDFKDRKPTAADVLCVIEVADSSLADDRDRKQRIYADHGIGQYLIINLVDGLVEEYAEPEVGRGRYARVTPFPAGKRVEIRTAAGKPLAVPVRSLLP
ncbi:MAG: hypothetical protein JWO31_1401 [Phycisphaerales bacterium]|nr:hypothetical protein [Phycisphaerales bacterium]